jgi:hypothetical protein
MKHEVFTSPKDSSVERHSLKFGDQKINLHLAGHEFEPKAQTALPGTADLVSKLYAITMLSSSPKASPQMPSEAHKRSVLLPSILLTMC